MATPSDISVGLSHELAITACTAGWEPKDFAELAHSAEKCRQVLSIIRGHAEVMMKERLIDLDLDPFIPNGWSVEEHRKGGKFVWDLAKVRLYLSPNQKGKKRIEGNKLRTELAEESVFNANLLDYLLANLHLIPEEWKQKAVFFWGTIYRRAVGDLCVRYLCWCDGQWRWFEFWLGCVWNKTNPALVRA